MQVPTPSCNKALAKSDVCVTVREIPCLQIGSVRVALSRSRTPRKRAIVTTDALARSLSLSLSLSFYLSLSPRVCLCALVKEHVKEPRKGSEESTSCQASTCLYLRMRCLAPMTKRSVFGIPSLQIHAVVYSLSQHNL